MGVLRHYNRDRRGRFANGSVGPTAAATNSNRISRAGRRGAIAGAVGGGLAAGIPGLVGGALVGSQIGLGVSRARIASKQRQQTSR